MALACRASSARQLCLLTTRPSRTSTWTTLQSSSSRLWTNLVNTKCSRFHSQTSSLPATQVQLVTHHYLLLSSHTWTLRASANPHCANRALKITLCIKKTSTHRLTRTLSDPTQFPKARSITTSTMVRMFRQQQGSSIQRAMCITMTNIWRKISGTTRSTSRRRCRRRSERRSRRWQRNSSTTPLVSTQRAAGRGCR